MGKGLGNAIFLSDSTDVVAAKVKGMYTDAGHLHVEDPGKVEGNPVFTYLDAFGIDKVKIADLKAHYQRGGLGDSVVKKYLLEVLQAFLDPIRQRRESFAKDPAAIMKILFKGTEVASTVAHQTLVEVRDAMGINY